MKIGVNVSWLTPGKAGGMENYVRNLLDELEKIDTINEYYLITAPNNFRTFNHESTNWHKIIYPGQDTSPTTYLIRTQENWKFADKLQIVYRNFKCFPHKVWNKSIAELVKKFDLDLWFCPVIYSLPLGLQIPVVNTIPDLQHEEYPEKFVPAQLAQRIFGYHYSCHSATATLAISEHVADQIISNYKIDKHKVIATPLGIEPSFVELSKKIDFVRNQTQEKFKFNKPFIYFPSYGWKHKNHELLIEAFAKVREQGFDINLVFSGERFDLEDRLSPLIKKFQLTKHVQHLGYIEKQDVLGLYTLASAVVFPSLFEGFGLPVLEALYLGAPVACSRLGSLVEIAGDAAEYFDPTKPQEISKAIISLLRDDELRLGNIEKGKERAKLFTYQHTARKTFEVFEAIKTGKLKPPAVQPFNPLKANNQLQKGEGRWFFHIKALELIRFQILLPSQAPGLAQNKIKVFCNGFQVIDEKIEPKSDYTFEIHPPIINDDNLYKLEVKASKEFKNSKRPLDLHVRTIVAKTKDGREIKLI